MRGSVAATIYEDFEPSSELVQEEDSDTLLLYLPGFKKAHIRVQLIRGTLRISGLRPIDDNKWRRFQKEFPVSANCDTHHISARLEGGILFVKQPKLITPAHKHVQHQELPASNAPEPQKPADESRPHKNFQEPGAKRTEGLTTRTGGNDVPEEAREKAEERTTTGKSNGPVKNGRKETKTDSTNAAETKNKATSGNENGNGKTSLTGYGDIAGGMAAKQKMPRRAMNVVLAVLLALLLGLYLSNWIASFRKAGN